MNDYMKDAERYRWLCDVATEQQWVELGGYTDKKIIDGAIDAMRGHIQRGAVPMPKPVAYGFGNTAITGHTNRLMMVRIDIPGGDQYAGAFWLPLVLADEAHTYGIACRAAGEAAGYARGLTEAGREAKRLADAIVREVAELPDRDSPADWPAAMLVTSDELRGIVLAAMRGGGEAVSTQEAAPIKTEVPKGDSK